MVKSIAIASQQAETGDTAQPTWASANELPHIWRGDRAMMKNSQNIHIVSFYTICIIRAPLFA